MQIRAECGRNVLAPRPIAYKDSANERNDGTKSRRICVPHSRVPPYLMERKAVGFACLTPECRLILWKDSANERNARGKAVGFFAVHSRVPPYLMQKSVSAQSQGTVSRIGKTGRLAGFPIRLTENPVTATVSSVQAVRPGRRCVGVARLRSYAFVRPVKNRRASGRQQRRRTWSMRTAAANTATRNPNVRRRNAAPE